MTPAPSFESQLSWVRCGQSRMEVSLPKHSTSSIAKVSGTKPNRDWMVGCPEAYPSILRISLSWPWSHDHCISIYPIAMRCIVVWDNATFWNLQTTTAFSASCRSSQTGSPPTKMFPSCGPDPPISFTSEVLRWVLWVRIWSELQRWDLSIFSSGVNFSRNNAIYNINESTYKVHFILISSLKLFTYY